MERFKEQGGGDTDTLVGGKQQQQWQGQCSQHLHTWAAMVAGAAAAMQLWPVLLTSGQLSNCAIRYGVRFMHCVKAYHQATPSREE